MGDFNLSNHPIWVGLAVAGTVVLLAGFRNWVFVILVIVAWILALGSMRAIWRIRHTNNA